MFWFWNYLKIHFLICFHFFVSITWNGSTNAQMVIQHEIIVPRLEFKVIPSGKNSRAHTEWKCKMFFNVYLTTNTPVTIDVSSQKNLSSPVYLRAWYETTHTFIFSDFLLFFLCVSPVSLFHCLSLNIYLLFSPYRPFVLCDVGFYSFLLTRVAIYLL